MAFLGTESLKGLLSNSQIVLDDNNNSCYDENRVEQAAYALCLGSEAYRTDNKERKIENLNSDNRTIEINPGQFALLMTKEYVNIPHNMLAFISIKAKHKLKGLVNVSGFHVDPGFKGRLLFSVYNAGPATITLETNKPYFLIWFTELDKNTESKDLYNGKENHHQGQSSINLEYVDVLKRGELASPHILLKKIKANEDYLQRVLWIAGIITVICSSIAVKLWWDNDQFKKGYDKALQEVSLRKDIDSKITIFTKDSIYLKKVDSIVNSKLKQDVNKK